MEVIGFIGAIILFLAISFYYTKNETIGCGLAFILFLIFIGVGHENGFWNTFILFLIIGAIIYVAPKIFNYAKKENDRANYREQRAAEEEKERIKKEIEYTSQQRQQYASEFKDNAKKIIEECNSNRRDSEKEILCPNYESILLQKELWVKLNEAQIPLQKLKNIVAELTSNTKEEK